MSFKSTMSTIGSGLASATVAIHNSSIRTELSEIEEEMKKLQDRKDELEKRLITY